MAYRDFQAERVGDSLLKLFLETPQAIAVTPAGVSQDQQFARLSIVLAAVSKPPLPDRIDGKLGRVGRNADMNESMVAAQIVHTIGSRLAQSILREIVRIDFDGFSNPRPARILEISDQLFMLRIDADHGQSLPEESPLLLQNMAKLTVAIRMGWTCETLAICLQAQSSFFNSRITVTCERS